VKRSAKPRDLHSLKQWSGGAPKEHKEAPEELMRPGGKVNDYERHSRKSKGSSAKPVPTSTRPYWAILEGTSKDTDMDVKLRSIKTGIPYGKEEKTIEKGGGEPGCSNEGGRAMEDRALSK